MTWKLRLSAQAEQDLDKILSWTRDHFGAAQAKTYALTISLALESLFDGPHGLGTKTRPELGTSVRTLHVARNGRNGRHFIVFRSHSAYTIEVLRILHDSMDMARHIP